MADFLYDELYKIGSSILLGIAMAVVYDVFRILRTAFHHNTIALSTEDLLFFICIIFPVFNFTLKINNGVFRVYLVLGVIFGFMVYRETLGRFIVWLLGNLISKICKILNFILKKNRDTIKIKDNTKKRVKRRWHSEKKTED